MDSEGKRAPLLCLDQRRRRPRIDATGEQIHQGGLAGDEGQRGRRAEARCRLHRHQHDQNIQGEQHQLGRRHDPDDGSARSQEPGRAGMLPHRRRNRRRHPLGVHEIPAPRHHREPGDSTPDGISLQHPRHGRRGRRDRIIQPGDIVFMDLAALTWNGYKSCYYRTYCVGKEPTKEQKDTYATALEWLYDSIGAVKAGTTTREIAKKWPSAKEAWGYKEEDQAAANLWGHGLGLAQYDPPVISRIWSLDHPIDIQEGMTFALETQHGKRFRYGVRIEEMLIVKKNEIEIISNFPVKQITVVDPIPGYGDHVK